MTPKLLAEFFADNEIQMPKEDLSSYADFAFFYFKELVNMGVFLTDIPFAGLTTKAKYLVLRSAYKLWKKAEHEQKLV